MKKVLSVLVSFVFLQVQSWALSGGPVFQNDLKSYQGKYAGVLIPQGVILDATATATTSAVGLFSLEQPESGFATGVTINFIDGAVYNGTIQGIIDPKDGALNGILDATSSFDVVSTTGLRTKLFAQGTITGKVAPDRKAFDLLRIAGTASMDLFSRLTATGTKPIVNNTVTFEMDGFFQTNN